MKITPAKCTIKDLTSRGVFLPKLPTLWLPLGEKWNGFLFSKRSDTERRPFSVFTTLPGITLVLWLAV